MANYLLLYHGGSQPSTSDEGAKSMEAWQAWFGSLGAATVDIGDPTGPTKRISASGVSDDANGATGYSIIAADSIDAAVELAKGCPHLGAGGTVSVSEKLGLM